MRNKDNIASNFNLFKSFLKKKTKKNCIHSKGISAFLKIVENTFNIIEKLKVFLLEFKIHRA